MYEWQYLIQRRVYAIRWWQLDCIPSDNVSINKVIINMKWGTESIASVVILFLEQEPVSTTEIRSHHDNICPKMSSPSLCRGGNTFPFDLLDARLIIDWLRYYFPCISRPATCDFSLVLLPSNPSYLPSIPHVFYSIYNV